MKRFILLSCSFWSCFFWSYFFCIVVALTMGDQVPEIISEIIDVRLRAVGATDQLPERLKRALDPGTDFEGVPEPKPGDWLAENKELGQTFDEFLNLKTLRPVGVRNTIFLQPLGEFTEDRSPSVESLREYLQVYFGMQVEVLPAQPIAEESFETRFNPFSQHRQVYVDDVMQMLSRKILGSSG